MTIDTNDPRLTAYALNELDAADRDEIECLLAESPDARAEVDAIRATAARLSNELAAEPLPDQTPQHVANTPSDNGQPLRLTNEDHQQIEARALAIKLRRWIPIAIAASVLLVCGLSLSVMRSKTMSQEDMEKLTALGYLGGSRDMAINPSNENMLARVDAKEGKSTTADDTWGAYSLDMDSPTATPTMTDTEDFSLDSGSATNSQTQQRLLTQNYDGRPRSSPNTRGGLGGGRFLDGSGIFGRGGAQVGENPQEKDSYGYDGSIPSPAAGHIELFVPKSGGHAISLDGIGKNQIVATDNESKELRALGYIGDKAAEEHIASLPSRSGSDTRKEYPVISAHRHGADERKDDDSWWNRPRDGHPPIPENTGEAYNRILDNPFLPALQNPLSTFSIDVDTASYSNIRRMLNANQLPPPDAVRIEEMVNYFSFDYDGPTGQHPFAVHLETASCPWDAEHRLLRVGLKGRVIEPEKRPACNLVFLIDVSGSMDCANKLPLVKQALAMLTRQLTPADRVAMVVYAGASGVALPSTPAGEKQKILDALDNLQAGGSTNGGEGIQLAYDIATQYLNKEGVNRVILCTDGDFNVGITDREKLVKLITTQAKSGVFLSVLGFGMGNLKDATLEQLADKGNGHYAYIDTFAEAKKVLVDEIGSTLVTIAKDVKIQIEFNPAQVAAYRLVGYENRILAARDFNDDKKDAGEIGAGHTVTALYEIVPMSANMRGVDSLKYQKPADAAVRADSPRGDGAANREMLTVKLRYKQPTSDTSTLIEVPLVDSGAAFEGASPDLRFAAGVAGFGMMLRNSPHKGDLTYDDVISMAVASMSRDAGGQRSEFIDLVRKAKTLSGRE